MLTLVAILVSQLHCFAEDDDNTLTCHRPVVVQFYVEFFFSFQPVETAKKNYATSKSFFQTKDEVAKKFKKWR